MEENNGKLRKVVIFLAIVIGVGVLVCVWVFARGIVNKGYRVSEVLKDVAVSDLDTDEYAEVALRSEISYEITSGISVDLKEVIEEIIKSDLSSRFKDMKGISEYARNGGSITENILNLREGEELKEGYDGIMFVDSLESVCVTEDNYIIFRYGNNILVVCDYNDVYSDSNITQKVYVGNLYSLLLLGEITDCEELKGYKVYYMKG